MGPKGETERTKELDNLPLAVYYIATDAGAGLSPL